MKFNSFIFIIWLYIDNYICIYLVYWADPECYPNVERAFLLAWERPFIYFFLYDYCLGNIFINKTCSADYRLLYKKKINFVRQIYSYQTFPFVTCHKLTNTWSSLLCRTYAIFNYLNTVQFVTGKLIFLKYFSISKNLKKNDELSSFAKVKINPGHGSTWHNRPLLNLTLR